MMTQPLKLDDTKFTISFFDGTQTIKILVGWDEFKMSINFLENGLKFNRTPKIQRQYDAFMHHMKENDKDMAHYILNHEMVIDNCESIGIENKYILRKNKFPYDFGNHRHYLLWIHPKCDKSLKAEIFKKTGCENIIRKLSEGLPTISSDNFIIFRNASKNKSVESIEHFHVIFY